MRKINNTNHNGKKTCHVDCHCVQPSMVVYSWHQSNYAWDAAQAHDERVAQKSSMLVVLLSIITIYPTALWKRTQLIILQLRPGKFSEIWNSSLRRFEIHQVYCNIAYTTWIKIYLIDTLYVCCCTDFDQIRWRMFCSCKRDLDIKLVLRAVWQT